MASPDLARKQSFASNRANNCLSAQRGLPTLAGKRPGEAVAHNQEGQALMGEEPQRTEPAPCAFSGRETAVRKQRRRWAAPTAFPAGGGCLAFGLVLAGHSSAGPGVRLPRILGECIEVAAGVLLIAAAIAVLIVLIFVSRCFWTLIRNVGDQDMANRRIAPVASFWELLMPGEQADLTSSAVQASFQPDSILCREGQRADHVFVIRSGRIAICVESPNGQQVVAIRHAGDIVGERAALQVGERSATIMTLTTVSTYVVPTQNFSAFLHRHPRVLKIIENQIYGRLKENRPLCAITEDKWAAGAARPAGTWNGQNCTVVLIDIAGFGASTRSDNDRRRIRMILYRIAQSLFEAPDQQHDYHCEDRGDGILLIVPPHVPTGSIVNRILGDMAALLHQHNSTAEAAARIQMRVSLDVGPVVSDAHGVDGLAIIHAARLLNAPALKRHLAETGTDLGFITSPFVYGTIIQPNPGHVDPAAYQQMKCRVKRQALNAWMYVPQTPDEIQPPAA